MFTKFIAWLKGFNSALLALLKPIFTTAVSNVIAALLPVASEIVTEIAKTRDLPNAKRDAAYAQLKTAAVSAGITASSSVLNLVIELAVQNLKQGDASGSSAKN